MINPYQKGGYSYETQSTSGFDQVEIQWRTHVIAAGSLLETLLAQPKSYSVGMINLLNIYPLTFDEFLDTTDAVLYAYYFNLKKEPWRKTLSCSSFAASLRLSRAISPIKTVR